jgi:hypothetical protein
MAKTAEKRIAEQWNREPALITVDRNKEVRCPNCKKLLAKGEPGKLEIKCSRCHLLCRFERI